MQSTKRLLDTLATLDQRGCRLAVAESMTGGLLALHITRIPGSGSLFVGGLVTYQNDAKRRLLDVPSGPVVSGPCAQAMAQGVARLFHCDVALATTGVAGPDTQEGQPVGTVYLGWQLGRLAGSKHLMLPRNDADDVRAAVVDAALDLLSDITEQLGIGQHSSPMSAVS